MRSAVWYCPTAALDNGSSACHARRLGQEQARALLRLALEAGGRDNITLILYRYDGRTPQARGEGTAWKQD